MPETQPALRFTSKGDLFADDYEIVYNDMIGNLMMGRTWIGWTTTMMISSGKISAKAKMMTRTRTSHQ